MAVYRRGYAGYDGPLTPEWSRWLIIARYAYQNVFESRLFMTYFVICFIWPVIAGVLLYLPHNAAIRGLVPPDAFAREIDGLFWLRFLTTQSVFAFLLVAFIGPGLVSADLANGALPLYFCRAFSRTEYVLGKMAVLAILLSAITWVPGLALFFFNAALEGWDWTAKYWYIPWGIFAASWLWILLLCLLALAVSACLRRRIVAGGLILGVFFVGAGFGAAVNQALNTHIGDAFNIVTVFARIWSVLLGAPARTQLSAEAACMALAAMYCFCLYLLDRKVRAYEVVK
ncbi:MAG: hypothetical protein ACM3ZB_02805 [bacterium]|jgi:ABC-2 type transport system permease protein